MDEKDLIENIILHENAYFFIKEKEGFLTKKIIENSFKEASKEKQGHALLNVVKSEKQFNENIKIEYSLIVFKYNKKPSFIYDSVNKWEEVKLGYLCIIDFNDYVVIARRNISGIKELMNKLEPMDYSLMTSLYVEDDTSYEKIKMNNMSIADNAIRQKSVESVDLKENLPALGLQGYMLNDIRINNNDNKISLSFNTSKINKLGPKIKFFGFLNWAASVIDRIETYTPKISFLSSFATSIDYSKNRDLLVPTSILITLSKLYSEFEENKINRCFIRIGDKERDINLFKVIKHFERLLKIKEDNGNYKIINNIVNDIFLSLNVKSITLRSRKLSRIYLEFNDDFTVQILKFFNWNKNYIITFDEANIIYCNRKLFKDDRLLGNIEAFLKIFIPYKGLENVVDEKGKLSTSSIRFSNDSIFGFVEKSFKDEFEYFICDDLGNEWADHIGLSNESISFYHSKSSKSKFSASDLHDVIGQALKNLGNLSPSDQFWPLKESSWAQKYNGKKVNTKIPRIRKGGNSKNAVEYFKLLKTFPNLKKRVFIVINFISKSELEDRLNKLKNEEPFKERNEIIQILWFVSSLISSCLEANSEIYICCKP
ncbi:hypothetical protein [Chryseobacterium sp.]|uniref:hypothetical protein n=1 Tax=Chryseobacterium sp. TaxID=1871047 RepID=UPI001AFE2F3B|nr:hypothetical protein [Chryseobacterium sp.]MBO9691573.1 hypothetical protein [Chryseobacterium sp.]